MKKIIGLFMLFSIIGCESQEEIKCAKIAKLESNEKGGTMHYYFVLSDGRVEEVSFDTFVAYPVGDERCK